MGLVPDLIMYGRFGLGLGGFLRDRPTPESAAASIRRRLEQREENFLRVVERGVFGYPKSPYLPLFKMARCEFGDLRDSVRREGLEATLLALRESGMYLSFEECKGREPIVRDGHVIAVQAHDFDNPYLKTAYYSESGGSTGAGTRVHHDLDYLAERSDREMLLQHAHGVAEAPAAVWRGVLPDGSGINNNLVRARCGRPAERWFTPVSLQEQDLSLLKFRVATQATVLLARALGTAMPWPEKVSVEQARVVARWAADAVRRRGKCVIFCVASRALRVSVAAQKEGLDLSGTVFCAAGEPMTPAKAKGIHASGATYFTTYGFSEAGRIGGGCCNPISSNDLHLYSDMCAVFPYMRPVPGQNFSAPAFNVTCLSPSSPKILINAESDDYGVIEERDCGCAMRDLGFKTHVRDIRSFRKLTGEGVTMMGGEILHVIEEVMPARFGGSALDYQILEEEDEQGFTRLSLIVSPSVPVSDEATLAAGFLDAVCAQGAAGGVASYNWRQADSIRIKRMQPLLTGRGKLLPLYVASRHKSAPTGSSQ